MTEASARLRAESPELVFLHAAPVHVRIFDTLLRQRRPQVRARHVVREDLLAAARGDPADKVEVERAGREAVAGLAAGTGSVVLCTCSTIGGADSIPGSAGAAGAS